MKKFKLFLTACITMLFFLNVAQLHAQWSGTGTAGDPYEITSAEDLAALATSVNGGNTYNSSYFVLTKDIDLTDYLAGAGNNSGAGWMPIGANLRPFRGNFNGNDKTIKGLWISRSSADYIGLFGYVGLSALIQHIKLEIACNGVEGRHYVGGLIGRMSPTGTNNAFVDYCSVKGGPVIGGATLGSSAAGGNGYAGGLIGLVERPTIRNCSAEVEVRGFAYVGGLLGYAGAAATVEKCYATGNVVATGVVTVTPDCSFAGGFVGNVGTNNNTFRQCYATGNVTAIGAENGGFVGCSNAGTNTSNTNIFENCYAQGNVNSGGIYNGGFAGYTIHRVTMTNCYSTGKVDAPGTSSQKGGFIGYADAATGVRTFVNNFWDTQTSGMTSYGAGIPAGQLPVGKSTADMKTQTTFVDWDFGATWTMDICGGYPTLEYAAIAPDDFLIFSGAGTSEAAPYEIYTVDELKAVAGYANNCGTTTGKYFKLMNDIDLTDMCAPGWLPIGNATNPFMGNFNGDGFAIKGLFIDSPDEDNIGLFGVVNGATAKIYDVKLEIVSITGRERVGGFAGTVWSGAQIENCSITGGKVTGDQSPVYDKITEIGLGYAGGFVGYLGGAGTKISNCYSTVEVEGVAYVGGFAAYAGWGATIEKCYATGDIEVTGVTQAEGAVNHAFAGGFIGNIGTSDPTTTISQCYTTSNVLSTGGGSHIGGFVGSAISNNSINATRIINIDDCYATGEVNGGSAGYVGGFIGHAYNYVNITNCYTSTQGVVGTTPFTGGFIGRADDIYVIVTNCYYSNMHSTGSNSGGTGTPKSLADMKLQSTYDGWNFATTWFICNDYPSLLWEGKDGGGSTPLTLLGEGTSVDNPYEINNEDELAELARFVNNCGNTYGMYFKVMDNITLDLTMSSTGWEPIGNNATHVFRGNFNGNGKEITGLWINEPTKQNIGLFGRTNGATIYDLKVKLTGTVEGETYVGGLIGCAIATTVERCYTTGGYVKGGEHPSWKSSFTGGFIGLISTNSYISQCFSDIDVTASSADVGGFVGHAQGDGTLFNVVIENCYSQGSVHGEHNDYESGIGGFIGYTMGGVHIINCYSSGAVTCDGADLRYTGGFIGKEDEWVLDRIDNCYYDAEENTGLSAGGGYFNTTTYGAGPSSVFGLGTADMKDQSNYTGWDFTNVWTMCASYPALVWEGKSFSAPKPDFFSTIGTDGSSAFPYLIKHATDLAELAIYVNHCGPTYGLYFELVGEIDDFTFSIGWSTSAEILPYENEVIGNWLPIGTATNPFRGNFNGNEKIISGLKIDNPMNDYIGLFGHVVGATIKNVYVEDVDIYGGMHTGGFAGYIIDSEIDNCYTTGTVKTSYSYVGGFVGRVEDRMNPITTTQITNCYSTCRVLAENKDPNFYRRHFGGFAGSIEGVATVKNCYATGDVDGLEYLGGFAGSAISRPILDDHITIEKCYAIGNVTSIDNINGISDNSDCDMGHIGGFIGGIMGYSDRFAIKINQCFATGDVTGYKSTGGFAGVARAAIMMTDCYAQGDVKADNFSPSVFGKNNFGGFFGYTMGDPADYLGQSFTNCYSSGAIIESGADNVGGFVGHNHNADGDFKFCFYDITKSPYDKVGTHSPHGEDITDKTTAQMKTESTFNPPWDFANIWYLCGDYPKFKWQDEVVLDPAVFYLTGAGISGSGDSDSDPYLIGTAAQLYAVSEYVAHCGVTACKHFILTDDIDLAAYQSGKGWQPIGTAYNPFAGTFDGDNNTIKNLKIASLEDMVGLFGLVSGSVACPALIKNFTIEDAEIEGRENVGTLVGFAWTQCNFENCTVNDGSVKGGQTTQGFTGGMFGQVGGDFTIKECYANDVNVKGVAYVGGLAGYVGFRGTVTQSSATGTVEATGTSTLASALDCSFVGGFIGNVGGTNVNIFECFANTDITSAYDNAGGFIGSPNGTIKITDCYAQGTLATGILSSEETTGTGGFVGYAMSGVEMENCYTTVAITGTGSRIGAFIGHLHNSAANKITNCYYDKEINGSLVGIGLKGASAESNLIDYYTVEMQNKNSYATTWDFDDIWKICDAYPHLTWEDMLLPDPPMTLTLICGASSPYTITDAQDLVDLAKYVNSGGNTTGLIFYLGNDIDMGSVPNMEPIGRRCTPFKGIFDGQGFFIENIDIDITSEMNIGFFGYTENAEIKNLGVKGTVKGGVSAVGGLVGRAYETNMTNCYFKGDVKGIDQHVGGFAGVIYKGNVKQCYAEADVTAAYHLAGGFAGVLGDLLVVEECYAKGTVTLNDPDGWEAGGFVGMITGLSDDPVVFTTITNCYAICEVTGNNWTGGFVGYTLHGSTIENCYAAGKINGTSIGGFVGQQDGGIPIDEIKNCFFDKEVAGTNDFAYGSNGITPGSLAKFTVEMMTESTFIGWVFTPGPWYLCNDYPIFRWQDEYTPPPAATTLTFAGSGTPGDPYLINDELELKELANFVNTCGDTEDMYFEVTQDFALTSVTTPLTEGWEPIGTRTQPFKGHFDGAGFVISGMWANYPATVRNVGLFGYVSGGSMKNLEVEISAAGVTGGYYVGGLAGGFANGTEVEKCAVTGTGQIVAIGKHPDWGNVSSFAGGLAGIISIDVTVSECYAAVEVIGIGNDVGGFAGQIDGGAEVTDCYAKCTKVRGSNFVGGFVGCSFDNSKIKNCYAAASVEAIGAEIGGFIGGEQTGTFPTITNCFYDESLCVFPDLTTEKATPKPYGAMTDEDTFTAVGWIFTPYPGGVWKICPDLNNGYPFLQWQKFLPVDIKIAITPIPQNRIARSGGKPMFPIVFETIGVDYIADDGLPAGITAVLTGTTITISGTVTDIPELYHYKLKLYNDCGYSIVDGGTIEVKESCPASPVHFDDFDYHVVELVTICWFRENLRSTKYNDESTPVAPAPKVYEHHFYDDVTLNENTFGLLYTLAAVKSIGNEICPTGWRLPRADEWEALTDVATGGYDADALRNPAYWLQPNTNTNTTHFNARGAGFWNNASTSYGFENILGLTMYWTNDPATDKVVRLGANYVKFRLDYEIGSGDAISVRCILND